MINVARSPDDDVFDGIHGVRADAVMLAEETMRGQIAWRLISRGWRDKNADYLPNEVSVFATPRFGIAHGRGRIAPFTSRKSLAHIEITSTG